jgi:hypothetical protein
MINIRSIIFLKENEIERAYPEVLMNSYLNSKAGKNG